MTRHFDENQTIERTNERTAPVGGIHPSSTRAEMAPVQLVVVFFLCVFVLHFPDMLSFSFLLPSLSLFLPSRHYTHVLYSIQWKS